MEANLCTKMGTVKYSTDTCILINSETYHYCSQLFLGMMVLNRNFAQVMYSCDLNKDFMKH